MTTDDGDDPFAPPALSPRGATALAITSYALAAMALVVAPLVTGAVGMLLGSLSHLKGSRLGMPAAVLSGLATVLGTANHFLLRT